MRILVLCNVPPGTVGGAEVQALQLAQRWSANGHEVTVAGPDNVPERGAGLRIERLPLWRAHRVTRAVSYLAVVLRFLWRKRREFDVVYCRFLREQAFAAALARRAHLIDRPVIACPASTSSAGEAERIARSPVRGIWLHVFRRGLSVINATSSRIEHEIRGVGLQGLPIGRIPNGTEIPPAPTRHPRPAVAPLELLFVGRLVPEKGIDVLLDAVHRVRLAGIEVRLRIVGSGPLEAQLSETITRLSLAESVVLRGALAPSRVAAEFASADAFVLASRIEGMPGVLLEAMAHSLPVIATRVSGAEDIVDAPFGWLVPPGDPVALADAIAAAARLAPDELTKMGRCARQEACERYDVDLVAGRYLKLFAQLTGTRSAAADDPELAGHADRPAASAARAPK